MILFQNIHLNLKTPPTLFIKYYIDESYNIKDGGDMGEILLFGRRVEYLYLNALFNFLNFNLWDKYNKVDNIDFIQLGNEFLDANRSFDNLELKYQNFVNINDFTKYLEKEINEDLNFINDMTNDSIDEETNLAEFFSRGKILGQDDSEKTVEEIISSIKRGSCLTHGDYYLYKGK